MLAANVKDYLQAAPKNPPYAILYGRQRFRLKGLIQHCAEGKITRWRTN